MAFEVAKAMRADFLEWSAGYWPLGSQVLGEAFEDRMATAVDRHLGQLEDDDPADQHNGYYRHRLTQFGDIELSVPRTHRYSPGQVIHAYAPRTRGIDRVTLAAFVFGLSIRKVGETLIASLGRRITVATVSALTKTLDAAVTAFHRRLVTNHYQALMGDGVALSCKTGAGAFNGQFWWRWGCGRTARRRWSTSAWPVRQTRPNGNNSLAISAAGSATRRSP